MKRLIKKEINNIAAGKSVEEKLRELSNGKIELLKGYFLRYIKHYMIDNVGSIMDMQSEQIYNLYFDQLQPNDIEQDLRLHAKLTTNQINNEFSEIINRLKFMFDDLKYEIGEYKRELILEEDKDDLYE